MTADRAALADILGLLSRDELLAPVDRPTEGHPMTRPPDPPPSNTTEPIDPDAWIRDLPRRRTTDPFSRLFRRNAADNTAPTDITDTTATGGTDTDTNDAAT